jgi:hypothetical protein
MSIQRKDIERALQPQVAYIQRLAWEGRAAIDRLPAVLARVRRALDHAGMADMFRLLRAAPSAA